MKRILPIFVLSFASLFASPLLEQAFRQPSPETRPGCYWYWINDNVSKEGITRDLEAMARVGIGRAYIGHIFNQRGPQSTPVGDVKFMSDTWWEAVQWAVKEAGRCGVEIGFFNSPGWSQSGGPWIAPDQSMRYLAASETVIEGGRRIEQVIPVPEINTFPNSGGSRPQRTGDPFTAKDFQDVSLIAFRQPAPETDDIDMTALDIRSPAIANLGNLLDASPATHVAIDAEAKVIAITFNDPVPVQSLRLDPANDRYTLTCVVEASDDGAAFREIANHTEQRGHQGPRNKDPILVPIPETTAKHLRVTLRSEGRAEISRLALSRRAVLGHYIRKQLGEVCPSTLPAWHAYLWDAQPGIDGGGKIASREVIDLSSKMDADGKLVWDAPEGRWIVMRAGMVPIGTQSAPTSPESRGLEVDKMSRSHVRSLFDGMMGEFLRRTPAAHREALKYVIADSYETGPQNWTDGLTAKFEQRFGYSPLRFLPAMNGRIVDSPEISSRFLWDWRRLIAESIACDYVGGLREVSNEHGLKLWLENYGHWGFPSEFLLYGSQSDQVGGEFWESSGLRDNTECRAASSAVHIYGGNDVYVEAFTSGRNFQQNPGQLKDWANWVHGAGINHFILHVNIHQPDERKPGVVQWFGTGFNRHNTWFAQSKAFIDYLRRSSVLLKTGRPVIDVAYHIGETVPVMTGVMDPPLPDGYDFNFINSDVLVNRARVEDGFITLENGPSYAVLVLPPQDVMRPEVAAAIQRLVRDGATIVGPRPSASPSLQGYPDCDRKVAAIAGELWQDIDGNAIVMRPYGKGRVYQDVPLERVLSDIGHPPAVSVSGADGLLCAAAGGGKLGIGKNGGIAFHQRRFGDGRIFFLGNTSGHTVEFTASLRGGGLMPELWDAVTGRIRHATAFIQHDGRTEIPLILEPAQCVFIVLRDPIAADVAGTATSNRIDFSSVTTLDGPWSVRFDGLGAPEPRVLDTLVDWARHPGESLRAFSGTGIYQTRFTLDEAAAKQPLTLDLGEAAVIATVWLNDREIGTVWTHPWRIDLGDAAVTGENTLEIRVANTWHNRLVTDRSLPADQRVAHTSEPVRIPKNAPLQKSGLLGPVRVLAR